MRSNGGAMSTISFPGLGIEPFQLNRVAIEIGFITIYWYGLIICAAIIIGFTVAYMRMKKIGFSLDDLIDLALICVPSGVVGARAYYVLARLEDYNSFLDVIAVWNGGLAIYGGIMGAVLAFVLVCIYKKKSVLKMCDCAAPGLILGQVIGRWGNFFNAEAYGISYSYDFFGKKLDISELSEKNPLRMTIDGLLVHPTFLYESLWNFLGFVLMNVLYKKRKFNGEVLAWYITWYGLGRCVIEGLRGDSLYIGSLRISQLIAFLCFAAGLAIIIIFRRKKHRKVR